MINNPDNTYQPPEVTQPVENPFLPPIARLFPRNTSSQQREILTRMYGTNFQGNGLANRMGQDPALLRSQILGYTQNYFGEGDPDTFFARADASQSFMPEKQGEYECLLSCLNEIGQRIMDKEQWLKLVGFVSKDRYGQTLGVNIPF